MSSRELASTCRVLDRDRDGVVGTKCNGITNDLTWPSFSSTRMFFTRNSGTSASRTSLSSPESVSVSVSSPLPSSSRVSRPTHLTYHEPPLHDTSRRVKLNTNMITIQCTKDDTHLLKPTIHYRATFLTLTRFLNCIHPIERSWPISVSTGLGLGYALSQCERNFNPTLVPVAKYQDKK